MDKIRILPDKVANQIAAGEVVGRPASVVKELMENAVDAGATSVSVIFKDGGKQIIKVIDNGCGMSESDARMAFERHATSKINSAGDLFRLNSFGFRGEALPSIASVSELEVITRCQQVELATRVTINGGEFGEQEYTQAAVGTQITVRNLFYNTPARRRFMKDSTVESRHIVSEFQRVALCNQQVEFTLFNNDALVYQLPADNLRRRIVAIHGKGLQNSLLELMADTSVVNVHGFVGQPMSAKKTNKEQYFFVNGRYFRSPYLHKAVVQAYNKLIATDTQPSYFIYITIDPSKIDVNVHPQKTEIKFDEEQVVWQILNAAVRESLGKCGMVPMMDFEIDNTMEVPMYRERGDFATPRQSLNPNFNPFLEDNGDHQSVYEIDSEGVVFEKHTNSSSSAGGYSSLLATSSDKSFGDYAAGVEQYHIASKSDDFWPDTELMEYISGEQTPIQAALEIGGQAALQYGFRLSNRYCVISGAGQMIVVDIARMNYRVLYERYVLMLGNNSSASQQLLFPEKVELSGEDYYLLSQSREELCALGFEVGFGSAVGFEGSSGGAAPGVAAGLVCEVEITGLPTDVVVSDAANMLREIASSIRENEDISDDKRVEKLAATMAKRVALFSGAATSNDALASICEELFMAKDYSFTPSGQLIFTTISSTEIEQRLK